MDVEQAIALAREAVTREADGRQADAEEEP